MCGIAGQVSTVPEAIEASTALMAESLNHRGPDARGVWVDPAVGVGLGHARLSIVELSPLGAQPMHSKHGRFVISYNGEIYNFKELAKELATLGWSFNGSSDTEVILASVEEWGMAESLRRFNGMFALAIWDRKERQLTLARDRIGKKPLYYGWIKTGLVFASELKAFQTLSAFEPQIDRESVSILLRHNYIPSPWSIYRGVYKLPPGTCLTLSLEQSVNRPLTFQPEPSTESSTTGPKRYWSLYALAEEVEHSGPNIKLSTAVDELEELLTDAVRLRMIADVPLGAFLSGGTDSSLVVALMKKVSGGSVQTFSVGFDEEAYDEAADAAAVATYLGTDHHELRVTAADAMNVIPKLPFLYDEPFSDSSQIPTFLVSEFARRSVTVAVSGDGGDECFCGYNRYSWARRIRLLRAFAPWPLHALGGKMIQMLSTQSWDRLRTLVPGAGKRSRSLRFGHRMHRLADFLQAEDPAHLYRTLISHWDPASDVVLGSTGQREIIRNHSIWDSELEFIRKMMLVDQLTYLPGDILAKIDRASMGVSLEVRAPLLDYRVVEFSWRLPSSQLVQRGAQKWILKQVLHRYVPRSLVERPKMGFGIPIQRWLAGPLREWAADLLEPGMLARQGYFDVPAIQRCWTEFISGKRPWDQHLWDVLMFQSWLLNFHERKNSALPSTDGKVIPIKRAG